MTLIPNSPFSPFACDGQRVLLRAGSNWPVIEGPWHLSGWLKFIYLFVV